MKSGQSTMYAGFGMTVTDEDWAICVRVFSDLEPTLPASDSFSSLALWQNTETNCWIHLQIRKLNLLKNKTILLVIIKLLRKKIFKKG